MLKYDPKNGVNSTLRLTVAEINANQILGFFMNGFIPLLLGKAKNELELALPLTLGEINRDSLFNLDLCHKMIS